MFHVFYSFELLNILCAFAIIIFVWFTFFVAQDMEAAGFQMRNADVRERAGELLRLNYGHSSPYGEGCSPGHNWFSGFMKRHQGGMWPTSPRNGDR